MAKKTKTEVVKPIENGKALARTAQGTQTKALVKPATKIAGKGFENVSREDLLIPRLKLLQPMSPEVTGELEQAVGTIFLNLSNKNLGKEITITPVLHYRSRIKWIPRDEDEGGGIDCSAADAKTPREDKYAVSCAVCTHKDWNNEAEKKKDQQPTCTLYDNFVVLVGDSTEPVVLSMEKSKAKVAKKFYSMAALKGGDFFENVYKLGVVKEKNDKGDTFYNYVVSDPGKKTDEKRRALCDSLWESLSSVTIVTKEDNPEAEAGQPVAAGEGKY